MRRVLSLVLTLSAGQAAAVACHDADYDGISYSICEVAPRTDDLQLFHKDAEGNVYGNFSAIEAAEGPLTFAMNAGMYHDDRSPVGLYVEDGTETQRLIPNAGPGNFGMLPNGVLCIDEDRARVIDTLEFRDRGRTCRDATQSGPMLVIEGKLHPRFLLDSTSRFIRNGVGTTEDGTRAVFVIANQPVTFYQFGSLFRDFLKLPNALYFDGKVSRLYALELGRADSGFKLGPIVGVLAK